MKKISLLMTATALLFSLGAQAQYVDVTSQYIPNADFEQCPALTPNANGVVILKQSARNPIDYADYGWKLEGSVGGNHNGGVAEYPLIIQPAWTSNDGPSVGPNGNTGKALVVTGNGVTLYKQSADIVLPAGQYKLIANIWAYAQEVSHEASTIDINHYTGFVTNDGTEYMSKARNANKVVHFASKQWVEDVIEFELTKETTGKIQLGYGTAQFVAIDNIKLEYLGGVVTTALENVITKATTLNAMLNNNTALTDAIGAAQAFVAAPTTQDAVTTEVEKLEIAMSTALATATTVLDITAAYVDNPSFETGTFGAWENEDAAVQAVPDAATSPVTQYCDGAKMVACSGAPVLTQTITHLPAGYYLVSAKLAGSAKLVTGTTNTSVLGGSNMLYLRVYAPAFNLTEAGNLVIGAKGSGTFNIDDFHLYYAKDAATIEAIALAAVKADATAILAETQYANITGEERSETVTAIEGTDYKAVNTKLNKFVASKGAYNDFVAAQQKAAPYTSAAYPYADQTMLQLVATNCSTTALSSTSAKEMTTQLKNAIAAIPMSNAYCEGVANKTDLTSLIVGADATGTTVNTAWTVNNIGICTISDDYKARPVMGQTTKDATVYGTPNSYKSGTASIQQTLSNLAAGTYVLSVSIMATKDIPVDVRINGVKKNTFVGVGTSASESWQEVVTTFEQTETANVTLRLDEGADATTKLWYADNFRLYLISGGATAIRSVNSNTANTNAIFDLSGRRVAQPTKGLYIVNGRKVVMK